jgi:hypothetical protein
MINSRQQFFWSIGFLIFLAVGGEKCTKTSATVANGLGLATYVSVMNLAPYAPTVDIYLNDTLVSPLGGVPPGKYSTQYGSLRPGVYDVKFKKTGTDSLLGEIPASSFDSANFYTLILYNTQPGGGAAGAVKIHDDFSKVSPASANYRFLNLSPDVPAVDLYFDSTLRQNGQVPGNSASLASTAAFQPIAPATYTLQIKATGTDSVLASLNGVILTAGNVYTIFLSGTDRYTNNLSINVLTAIY